VPVPAEAARRLREAGNADGAQRAGALRIASTRARHCRKMAFQSGTGRRFQWARQALWEGYSRSESSERDALQTAALGQRSGVVPYTHAAPHPTSPAAATSDQSMVGPADPLGRTNSPASGGGVPTWRVNSGDASCCFQLNSRSDGTTRRTASSSVSKAAKGAVRGPVRAERRHVHETNSRKSSTADAISPAETCSLRSTSLAQGIVRSVHVRLLRYGLSVPSLGRAAEMGVLLLKPW